MRERERGATPANTFLRINHVLIRLCALFHRGYLRYRRVNELEHARSLSSLSLTVKINGHRRRKLHPPWPFLSRTRIVRRNWSSRPVSRWKNVLHGARVCRHLCSCRACCFRSLQADRQPGRRYLSSKRQLYAKIFFLVKRGDGYPCTYTYTSRSPTPLRNPNNVHDTPMMIVTRRYVASCQPEFRPPCEKRCLDDPTEPCQPFATRLHDCPAENSLVRDATFEENLNVSRKLPRGKPAHAHGESSGVLSFGASDILTSVEKSVLKDH